MKRDNKSIKEMQPSLDHKAIHYVPGIQADGHPADGQGAIGLAFAVGVGEHEEKQSGQGEKRDSEVW